MRGRVPRPLQPPPAQRITPACAGKRQKARRCYATTADHPRVCGEERASMSRSARAWGSPPRVRGRAEDAANCEASHGITPACAGKSVFIQPGGHDAGDHPRVCGEERIRCTLATSRYGSPPRVRGRGYAVQGCPCGIGITPACAGKSGRLADPDAPNKDHPRVCGEEVPLQPVRKPPLGSPPRVRGRARRGPLAGGCNRITPACAGKSGGRGGPAY